MSELNISCMLCHFLFIKLVINCPDNEDQLWFLVNEMLLKLTYNYWCVIIGLADPVYTEKLDIPKSNVMTKISKTFLDGKQAIKCADFSTKCKHIGNHQFEDAMMVKLANLFFVECVLLGSDKKMKAYAIC